jgi:hypothetical protein
MVFLPSQNRCLGYKFFEHVVDMVGTPWWPIAVYFFTSLFAFGIATGSDRLLFVGAIGAILVHATSYPVHDPRMWRLLMSPRNLILLVISALNAAALGSVLWKSGSGLLVGIASALIFIGVPFIFMATQIADHDLFGMYVAGPGVLLIMFAVVLRFAFAGVLVNKQLSTDVVIHIQGHPVSAIGFLVNSIVSIVSLVVYMVYFFFSCRLGKPHHVWGWGLAVIRFRDFPTDRLLERRDVIVAVMSTHCASALALCICAWVYASG